MLYIFKFFRLLIMIVLKILKFYFIFFIYYGNWVLKYFKFIVLNIFVNFKDLMIVEILLNLRYLVEYSNVYIVYNRFLV